jgi:hypothetical protein
MLLEVELQIQVEVGMVAVALPEIIHNKVAVEEPRMLGLVEPH